MRQLLIAGVLSLLVSSVAMAAVTASVDGTPTQIGLGAFQYSYSLELQNGALQAGDFITIYDTYGYIPGTASSDQINWAVDDAASVAPVAPTSSRLEWTYQGPTVYAALSPVSVGRFTASSTTLGLTAAEIFKQPLYYYYDVVENPEPSTLILLGAGLAWILRRRWTV